MFSSVSPDVQSLPFYIQAEALSSLKRHLSYNYPHTACGFLFGEEYHDRKVITQAIPSCPSQCEEQNTRIRLGPHTYDKAEQYARRHGLQVLGLFRSFVQDKHLPEVIVLQTTEVEFQYCFISLVEGELSGIHHLILEE